MWLVLVTNCKIIWTFLKCLIYGWVFIHFVSHLCEVFKLYQVYRHRFTSIMSLCSGKYGLHACRCNRWHYGWLLLLMSESLNGQSLVSCHLTHVELRRSELTCHMYPLEQWVFICHTFCKVCIMEKMLPKLCKKCPLPTASCKRTM